MKLSSSLKPLIYPLLTVSVLATMAFGSSSETPQEAFRKVTDQLSNNLGNVTQKALKESREVSLPETSVDHSQLHKEVGHLFLMAFKELTPEEKHLMKDLIERGFQRYYTELLSAPFSAR